MALYFPDIVEHNNPDYAALDTDFLRGGTRSPVASLADLYALYPGKVDLLKERATRVYVSGEDKYYVLIDLANAGSSSGWAEDNSGGGVIENVVYTTGDQSVSGIKTFVDGISVGNDSNPVNTLYVRSGEVGINNDDPQAALDVSGLALFSERPQVNGTGVLLSGDIDVANLVYTTGNQIISGVKTFEETAIFNSGISVTGVASFTDRPTVNGTGVMLQGEDAGAGQLFTGDITVSIPNGTSFGKYLDGSTIPASGLSANDVIIMACFNAKEPTLTFTPDAVPFGFSGVKDLALTFSYTINTLGGLPSIVKIESKKTTDSTWVELRNETSNFTASPITQTHSINHTLYDTTKLQYRFTVKDNLGGEKIQIFELTPAPYVHPSISTQSIGAVSRYRGDTATTYTGTITKNTNLVPITSYILQRSVDSSANWINVGSLQNVSNPSTISINLSETDSGAAGSIVNSNSISYRVLVEDEYTNSISSPTTLGTLSVNFYHKCGVLYSSSTTINVSAIDSAAGMVLQDTKARTITGVSAGTMYTYYVYKSSAGSLSNILQDDALPVLSTWDRQADITGSNSNGASISYAVYRSKAPGAYTNKKLAFS